MGFKKEIKDGVTTITVDSERLDSTIAPEFKSTLLLSVDQGEKHIIIDLSKVNYADSSGLGAILFGFRQLKSIGGKLRLFAANNRIMSLVRIARLDVFLQNFDKMNLAVASFNEE